MQKHSESHSGPGHVSSTYYGILLSDALRNLYHHTLQEESEDNREVILVAVTYNNNSQTWEATIVYKQG